MKFMGVWDIPSENNREAYGRFLSEGAPAPEGLTILGRWHAPGGHGWVLMEADDIGPVTTHIAQWAHLLNVRVHPVMEDGPAAEAIQKAIAE